MIRPQTRQALLFSAVAALIVLAAALVAPVRAPYPYADLLPARWPGPICPCCA